MRLRFHSSLSNFAFVLVAIDMRPLPRPTAGRFVLVATDPEGEPIKFAAA